jgi:hypothetical protein
MHHDELYTGKFLSIHRTQEGYEYAERKGKDSVAFLLYDSSNNTVGYRNEYKPPVATWVLGAFGGSIDKQKSPVDIVIDEVAEEAMYNVSPKDVKYLGKYLVSTQMNQWCMLYAVDVTNNEGDYYSEQSFDVLESLSDTSWHRADNIPTECWKAYVILTKMFEKGLVKRYV